MAIESPCIRVCVIDPATGYCLGCGRSGAEIGGWIDYTVAERREIMATLPERLRTMTTRVGRPDQRLRPSERRRLLAGGLGGDQ